MPQHAARAADRRAAPTDGTLCRARPHTLQDHSLSPGGLRPLRPRIEAVAEELVDALVARGAREQSVDLVTAPAVPPPLMVIAEVSGVPAERWAEFRRRGRRNGATAGSAGAGEGLPGPTGGTDPAALRLDPGDEPARAQISLAVSTLLRRAGGLRLTVAPQDVPRRRAHCIRTPLRLPVTLTVAERGRE